MALSAGWWQVKSWRCQSATRKCAFAIV